MIYLYNCYCKYHQHWSKTSFLSIPLRMTEVWMNLILIFLTNVSHTLCIEKNDRFIKFWSVLHEMLKQDVNLIRLSFRVMSTCIVTYIDISINYEHLTIIQWIKIEVKADISSTSSRWRSLFPCSEPFDLFILVNIVHMQYCNRWLARMSFIFHYFKEINYLKKVKTVVISEKKLVVFLFQCILQWRLTEEQSIRYL